MSKSKKLKVEIVSAEDELFSGETSFVVVVTVEGELGIYPNHAQLLALLSPGYIKLKLSDNNISDDKYKLFYTSGGILEVQPNKLIVLSDTIVRAEDLDEQNALLAKQRAENLLKSNNRAGAEYAELQSQLAIALAQINVIRKLKQDKNS